MCCVRVCVRGVCESVCPSIAGCVKVALSFSLSLSLSLPPSLSLTLSLVRSLARALPLPLFPLCVCVRTRLFRGMSLSFSLARSLPPSPSQPLCLSPSLPLSQVGQSADMCVRACGHACVHGLDLSRIHVLPCEHALHVPEFLHRGREGASVGERVSERARARAREKSRKRESVTCRSRQSGDDKNWLITGPETRPYLQGAPKDPAPPARAPPRYASTRHTPVARVAHASSTRTQRLARTARRLASLTLSSCCPWPRHCTAPLFSQPPFRVSRGDTN